MNFIVNQVEQRGAFDSDVNPQQVALKKFICNFRKAIERSNNDQLLELYDQGLSSIYGKDTMKEALQVLNKNDNNHNTLNSDNMDSEMNE